MTTASTTAATIAGTTAAPPRRRPVAEHSVHGGTRLQRWAEDRRRRRYQADKRRHDARDRSDRYLNGSDDAHQRQALVAFVQR